MKSVNTLCCMIKEQGRKDAADNERGSDVYRLFHPSSRYEVDFAEDFFAEGWQQFDTDQDASYFGLWVNPTTRQTLCYCEGDWTLVECPTIASYNAEIVRACRFYGEGYIAKTVDTATGKVTEYAQDRTKFLIS